MRVLSLPAKVQPCGRAANSRSAPVNRHERLGVSRMAPFRSPIAPTNRRASATASSAAKTTNFGYRIGTEQSARFPSFIALLAKRTPFVNRALSSIEALNSARIPCGRRAALAGRGGVDGFKLSRDQQQHQSSWRTHLTPGGPMRIMADPPLRLELNWRAHQYAV